jgi:hypothetical protein
VPPDVPALPAALGALSIAAGAPADEVAGVAATEGSTVLEVETAGCAGSVGS